ncbi:bile acid:sodium symporter family protein [Leuconostoc mesenteroides]|jgi:BASS family bile acid:Na+ symporter|uniref:Na+-transporting methylmalonyl-CoA/oxaloacetate decarboxylase, beta subunit n=1 Tax=Leuconostoc mesenteroides subsp. mesenteroides (strain ATCC 8293 / DSM 20343 / BCRC 11652 / CCM 1803 / JCM 6124 / NCDO 523 / NBRC 100496 / NCIMB 8023 / NCTC 12954 / NRRL B-1118 / 37Y) TaxID=203120 RepID=Q03UL0_LEUMM|nr:bile acid:sodium symporter family protein [Leuconostoc mesenteroides]ABJ63112.1 Na+-transporting methylmalonyl-CoA/oxaloacetate decarboxylase, beta subunit [Leuconostoc mesenteroides subsp. mesenteroides ATCC 8293]MCT3042601.1 bile acid:sodium symporter family protein [Leuconostoc mesenteroides]MCU4663925.1 bile acid:sodium symporter family protein [Leuconostoc mesenteroides]MDG9746723.1 bile acid:sodium symporter family protein [Leuconostoc mesenteroides]QHM56986.1 Pantothenate precursors 
MNTIKSLSKFLTKYFTFFVILVALLAIFIPGPGTTLATTKVGNLSAVSILLMIVLFGMGITLTPNDFKRVARNPLQVILGTIAHYIIMPFIAFLLVHLFGLTGAAAVGVILVGSAPSGTSSNVMSFLSGGDVALDVSIGLLSTLLAPVMIPTLLKLLAGKWVNVPFSSMFFSAFQIVVIPIVLGIIVHTIFKEHVQKVIEIMPLISQVAILVIILAVLSANSKTILAVSTLILVPVIILHNLLGYLLGYGFSKLMKMDTPQQKAITFEVGMQDSALASTLAISFFEPASAIAAVMFSVWHNISGSVLASLWKNHTEKAPD